MIPAMACKFVRAISPGAIKDNASFTATEIDTKGFAFCTIVVQVGATDIAMAALKVQESDTSGSGFGDVTGLVFGTSTNLAGSTSTLPSATDDNKLFVFHVNLTGRDRYLKLVATAGNGTSGTYASAVACLSRAAEGPYDATTMGASQVLVV